MGFSLDNQVLSALSSSNPVTQAFTCGASAKLLIVGIMTEGTTPRGGTAPTYNGVAMDVGAIINTYGSYTEGLIEVYYMRNPPTGASYNVSASNPSGVSMKLSVVSFICTYTAVFDKAAVDTPGLGANPSVNIVTATNNQLIWGMVVDAYRNAPTNGANYTALHTYDAGAFAFVNEYDLDAGTAGTIAVNFVLSSSDWYGIIALTFADARAATGSCHAYIRGVGQASSVQHAMLVAKDKVLIDTGGSYPTVITTSGGAIYVLYKSSDGYSLKIKKSTNGGAGFTALSSVTSTTIHGTGTTQISAIDAAIDGNGFIHIVSQSMALDTRDIAYAKLDTSNDSWSSWEQAADYQYSSIPTYGKVCSISVDSNSKPHVTYGDWNGSVYYCYYTNKVGASWLAKEQINVTATCYYPKLLCHGSLVEAVYNTSGTVYPRYRTRDMDAGTWGSEGSYSNSSQCYTYKPITCKPDGTVYRYHSYNGTGYYQYENNVAVSNIDVYTYLFAPAIFLNTRVILYVDYSDRDLKYITNDGSGWTAPITLYEGTFTAINAETAYNFEYQGSRVNFLVVDSTGIYFDYIPIPLVTSLHAYMTGNAKVIGTQHAYLNSGTYVAGVQHAYIMGDMNILLPSGDGNKQGTWVNELGQTTDLYKSLDELLVPDDNDYIVEGPSVNGDYYECPLTDPLGVYGSGSITVLWRGRNNTSGSVAARVQLRQGSSTVIASRDQVLPTNPTTYSFVLTTEERALITDPTDLRMRFVVLR